MTGRARLSDDEFAALFAAARKVSVLELAQAEVTLRRASGGRFVGACPMCGGDRKSTRFGVTVARNAWFCFGERVGGGPVELERALRGGDARDAAQRLAGAPCAPATPVRVARQHESAADEAARRLRDKASRIDIGRRLWLRAQPAAGTRKERSLVEIYFAARGFDPGAPLVAAAIAHLRFAPHALAAGEKDERGAWLWQRFAPAMVAAIRRRTIDADGAPAWPVVGAHMTFLAEDGAVKADLRDPDGEALPAKKIYGAYTGAAALLYDPAALAAARAPIVIGEGIETTLAAATLYGGPCRPIAALTLGNLQGGYARDRFGRIDPDAPLSDPAQAPFTAPGAGNVIIAVDRDMAPVKVRAPDRTKGAAASKEVWLDAHARARLCASLAAQAWKRAGAHFVVAVQPPLGNDFANLIEAGA